MYYAFLNIEIISNIDQSVYALNLFNRIKCLLQNTINVIGQINLSSLFT